MFGKLQYVFFIYMVSLVYKPNQTDFEFGFWFGLNCHEIGLVWFSNSLKINKNRGNQF